MVFKKRFRRRTGKLAPKTRKAVKAIVKRALDVAQEDKWYHDTFLSTAIDTTPILTMLTFPPLGTSVNARIGDTIMAKSLQCLAVISPEFDPTGLLDTNTGFRFIIGQWKDRQPATPTAANILLPLAGTARVTSPYNPLFSQSYHIVYDRLINFNQSYGNVAINKTFTNFTKKLESNAATSIGLNQFFWIAVSESDTVDHPNIQVEFQLKYQDA